MSTKPEVALRSALRKAGLHFRSNTSALIGKPDIVFTRLRLAVFCDGDFWHGRNLEARLTRLKAGHNAPYWTKKIETNVARDRRNTEALEADGWRVIRVWESDIAKQLPEVVARIVNAYRAQEEATAAFTRG